MNRRLDRGALEHMYKRYFDARDLTRTNSYTELTLSTRFRRFNEITATLIGCSAAGLGVYLNIAHVTSKDETRWGLLMSIPTGLGFAVLGLISYLICMEGVFIAIRTVGRLRRRWYEQRMRNALGLQRPTLFSRASETRAQERDELENAVSLYLREHARDREVA